MGQPDSAALLVHLIDHVLGSHRGRIHILPEIQAQEVMALTAE